MKKTGGRIDWREHLKPGGSPASPKSRGKLSVAQAGDGNPKSKPLKKPLKATPIISAEQFAEIRRMAKEVTPRKKEIKQMNDQDKARILESNETIGRQRFAQFLVNSTWAFEDAMTALRAAPRDQYQVDFHRGETEAKRMLGR